jgi:hypothetical protein
MYLCMAKHRFLIILSVIMACEPPKGPDRPEEYPQWPLDSAWPVCTTLRHTKAFGKALNPKRFKNQIILPKLSIMMVIELEKPLFYAFLHCVAHTVSLRKMRWESESIRIQNAWEKGWGGGKNIHTFTYVHVQALGLLLHPNNVHYMYIA